MRTIQDTAEWQALGDDEKHVLLAMHYCQAVGEKTFELSVKSSDVRKTCGFEEHRFNNVLARLEEAGFVTQEESGDPSFTFLNRGSPRRI